MLRVSGGNHGRQNRLTDGLPALLSGAFKISLKELLGVVNSLAPGGSKVNLYLRTTSIQRGLDNGDRRNRGEKKEALLIFLSREEVGDTRKNLRPQVGLLREEGG